MSAQMQVVLRLDAAVKGGPRGAREAEAVDQRVLPIGPGSRHRSRGALSKAGDGLAHGDEVKPMASSVRRTDAQAEGVGAQLRHLHFVPRMR